MVPHITWFAYATTIVILLAIYYIAIWLYTKKTTKAPEPIPPQKEEWMDQILAALEETLRNAERKRYHPDEVILALQRKIEQLKNT
jgi:muramidase (phage lysozyme)